MTELPTARDYEGFRALLDKRRMELRFSMLELDEVAGLPSGYASKLLSKPRKPGEYYKSIGPSSMGKLLTALSLEISVTQRVASRQFLEAGKRSYPQAFLLAERGRRGGLARAAKLSGQRRRDIAKKAAAARWKDRTDG